MIIYSKYCLLIFLVFGVCSSCFSQKQIVKWDSLNNFFPIDIGIDTIEDVFLYELAVRGYADGDVFIKGGDNFVRQSKPFNLESYKKGYFIFRNGYLKRLADGNPLIHFDTASLDSIFAAINEMGREGLVYVDSNFNPTYGCYYKKFYLKIEVLSLGDVSQRVPLFAKDENELKKLIEKNGGKDYEIISLPTYLITRVFKYDQL